MLVSRPVVFCALQDYHSAIVATRENPAIVSEAEAIGCVRAQRSLSNRPAGRPHTAVSNVPPRSKCEELDMSKSSPLYPTIRTSTKRADTSLMGQKRNGSLTLVSLKPVQSSPPVSPQI
jgi:hypothetical protein